MEEGLLFQAGEALDDWGCVDHLVKDDAGGGAVPKSQAYSPHSDDTPPPLMDMSGKDKNSTMELKIHPGKAKIH